jgi:hypothetical protein
MGMNLAGAEERPQVSEKALAVEHQNLRAVVDSPAPEEQVWDVEVKISASRPEPVETAGKPKQFYEEELIVVLKTVGFAGDSLRQAWAVAMKESTGNPKAHNQNANTGDNSYGLFQINMIGKLGPSRLEKFGLGSYEDLFDPYVNASIAYEMSKGGKDWGAWGIGPNAYNGGTTGSYYKWLEEYSGG